MLKQSSVSVAKNRLKALVTSDRVQCLPDTLMKVSAGNYTKRFQNISKLQKMNFGIRNRENTYIYQFFRRRNLRLSRFRFTKRYRLKDYNCILVALVTALSILGIFVVGSAKEIYQTKQIFGVVAGLIIMVVVSLIDYVWIWISIG